MLNGSFGLLVVTTLVGMGTAPSAMAGNDQPRAEIRVDDVADGDLGEYDVMLVSINDEIDIENTMRYKLPPGMQKFKVASLKRGKHGEWSTLPFALEMKPCIRYQLVASYAQPGADRPWLVVVKSETPIKTCVKKHGAAQAMADTAP